MKQIPEPSGTHLFDQDFLKGAPAASVRTDTSSNETDVRWKNSSLCLLGSLCVWPVDLRNPNWINCWSDVPAAAAGHRATSANWVIGQVAWAGAWAGDLDE